MQPLAEKYPLVRYALKCGFPLAALIASYFWLPIIANGLKSPSWPTATAIVTKSEFGVLRGKRFRQIADVTYSYTVNSQSFTTNRYDQFGLLGSTGLGQREAVSEFVTSHPIGFQFVVRHHPSHPEFSLIQTGLDVRHLALTFALLFLYFLSYKVVRSG